MLQMAYSQELTEDNPDLSTRWRRALSLRNAHRRRDLAYEQMVTELEAIGCIGFSLGASFDQGTALSWSNDGEPVFSLPATVTTGDGIKNVDAHYRSVDTVSHPEEVPAQDDSSIRRHLEETDSQLRCIGIQLDCLGDILKHGLAREISPLVSNVDTATRPNIMQLAESVRLRSYTVQMRLVEFLEATD